MLTEKVESVEIVMFVVCAVCSVVIAILGAVIGKGKHYELLTYCGKPKEEDIRNHYKEFEIFGSYFAFASYCFAVYMFMLGLLFLVTKLNERYFTVLLIIPFIIYFLLTSFKAYKLQIMVTKPKLVVGITFCVLMLGFGIFTMFITQ